MKFYPYSSKPEVSIKSLSSLIVVKVICEKPKKGSIKNKKGRILN